MVRWRRRENSEVPASSTDGPDAQEAASARLREAEARALAAEAALAAEIARQAALESRQQQEREALASLEASATAYGAFFEAVRAYVMLHYITAPEGTSVWTMLFSARKVDRHMKETAPGQVDRVRATGTAAAAHDPQVATWVMAVVEDVERHFSIRDDEASSAALDQVRRNMLRALDVMTASLEAAAGTAGVDAPSIDVSGGPFLWQEL